MPKWWTLGCCFLLALPAWSQSDNQPAHSPIPVMVGLDNSSTPAETPAQSYDGSDDRMVTPPPVSGQTYPVMLASEERANYLRGGLAFTAAYTDNLLAGLNGTPISDISYSVAPTVALDETTSRVHAVLSYAPGFTFYQKTSSRNEADQNASIEFEYRLTPHVTLSARDGFQKSSNVFNQPSDFGASDITGTAQGTDFSVIAPVADRLSNVGNVGLSYQFGLNDMTGVSGTFSNLHYPNPAEVPGLYDASSQGGMAFYSRRLAKRQYVGIMYGYQRLLAYPTQGTSETQTHAAFLFCTVSPTRNFSISLFGGPQHAETLQPSPLATLRSWNPAGGASATWQGRLNTFALSYTHIIASSGGLIGAAEQDAATATIRQQILRTLNASISGGYAQNNVIGSSTLQGLISGHSVVGTATLQQLIGQHLGVQLGYARIHQDYDTVAAIATNPNTNREFIAISYQFSKALGR